MNYKLIIKKLNQFDEDELFYREFYNRKKAGQPVDELLRKYRTSQELLGHVLHPEMLESKRPEEEFFAPNRNTAIVKHPRYFPVFHHEHSFFEMIYVFSGKCIQHFSNKTVELTEGDLCIMAPDVTHAIEVFDDSLVLNILIRHSTFMDIFINTVRDKTQISMFFLNNIYAKKKMPYLLFHTGKDPVIRNYILDMYMEQIQPDEFSDRIICSIMTIFFTQLIRRHKKNLIVPQFYAPKNAYENDLFNYIVNNYAETSLEEVAGYFHFSVPYCSKLIKEAAGCTFSELQENIRLQQSENYLLYTQLSVADISEKIGFKNPETFIRMFKRHRQITPSSFRKMHGPKEGLSGN